MCVVLALYGIVKSFMGTKLANTWPTQLLKTEYARTNIPPLVLTLLGKKSLLSFLRNLRI